MTTLDVKLNVSDDVLEYLRREAESRNVPLDVVISEVLADYFDEPTEEEILTGLRRSMKQVLAGDFRPAREVLDEIEREAVNDADNG
jgi:predicted transcriptional regulator